MSAGLAVATAGPRRERSGKAPIPEPRLEDVWEVLTGMLYLVISMVESDPSSHRLGAFNVIMRCLERYIARETFHLLAGAELTRHP